MSDKITRISLGQGGKGHTDWKRVDALAVASRIAVPSSVVYTPHSPIIRVFWWHR